MKILLADDEKDFVQALSQMLKSNNYSVDCVYNGQDAYDYAMYTQYDAIILDVMMPSLDGFEVAKKLRESNVDIPIMFLSAKGELEDRIKGLDLGGDDYLTKPFQIDELLARLRVIIRRSNKETKNVISYGNLTLNISTYKLICGDKEINLINKEFQIMELFMLQPDKVFSTNLIMEKVWNIDTLSDISTVWVFISNLRKKIDFIGGNVIIKSNRGAGYSLELKD
jgi:two-component system, OmpR family, response regulator ArlR